MYNTRFLEIAILFYVEIKSLTVSLVFLTAGRLQMLMIGHFIGKETKLLELSKRGEETQLEFKRTAHYLGGYLAISYLLHVLRAVLLCLLHSPSGLEQ